MVLQTSGPISLADIRDEFGGAPPDPISDYYRGGGIVPDTPANSGIPTSGAISFSDFYGGDATTDSVILTNHSSDHNNPASVCNAGFAFDPDGTLYDIGPAATDRTLIATDEWWSGRPDTGIGSSYEVRCQSITAGTVWDIEAAAVGTWIDISSERIWRVTVIAKASPDAQTVTGTFQIRENGGDGTILASASLSARAEN